MDQTSIISDAISQTSSLLGGLLSQIGINGAKNNIFSNLLSQNSQTVAPAATQTPPTQTTTASASSPLFIPSSASTLLQNLEQMADTMKQILNVLHQQNGANSQTAQSPAQNNQTASQTTAPAAQTPATSVPPATTPPSSAANPQTFGQKGSQNNGQSTTGTSSPSAPATTTEAATSADATSSSPPTDAAAATAPADAQTLAGIIAQLLALTELMIKNLQQTQTAGGGTAASGQTTVAAAAVLSASPNANALLPLSADLSTAIQDPASTPVADITAVDPTTTAMSPDALPQLLVSLQKITQQLLPQTNTAGATASLVQAAATTTTAVVSSIETQIALLDAKLKDFMLAAKQIDKIAASAIAAAASAPAAVTTKLMPDTTATSAQTSASTTKQDSPETSWQSQMFAIASPSSNQQSTSPTASQVFANSAALVAAADNNSGSANSDANPDLLSGDRASTSPFSLGPDAAATAGGVQATGTYNFASTLSAIRAANGGATGLPNVVDQVILQMNRSVKTGDNQMAVQLNPADLGKITVKLDIGSDGKVQGTVTADNPQTLGMLQKDSRSLERALQDAGLRADPGSLQFSLSGQENGRNANQTANNGNGNANTPDGTIPAEEILALTDSASTETYYLTPNGVNIQV